MALLGRRSVRRCRWLDAALHQNSLERHNDPAVILGYHLTMLLDFRCAALGYAELGLFHIELIGLEDRYRRFHRR